MSEKLLRKISSKGSIKSEKVKNGNETGTPPPASTSAKLVKFEELRSLLTCVQCKQFCHPGPAVHCRKGHMHCSKCKSGQTSCKVCKQTFIEGSNIVLDKIISLIAQMCPYKGCESFVFPEQKLNHETFCQYRPVACRFSQEGCNEEMGYKDIHQHHKVCPWNPNSNDTNK